MTTLVSPVTPVTPVAGWGRPGLGPADPADSADRGAVDRTLAFTAMGGTVSLRVTCAADRVSSADADLRAVAARIRAWADRLTRFDTASDLSVLNRDPWASAVPVGATLGAVLEQAMVLEQRTEGLVDVTLLDARLAAQDGGPSEPPSGHWWLERRGRHRSVSRQGRVTFDLDGVGKGWVADRALELLHAYPAAMVDADGDIALRVAHDTPWQVAIADPRDDTVDLAVLTVPRRWAGGRVGISTSGTSVHRWPGANGPRHHLIDPRTGRPAQTDVVQATVVAETALAAEALAKSAVISGSDEGLDLLERAGAQAEVLLLQSGDSIATLRTLDWMS